MSHTETFQTDHKGIIVFLNGTSSAGKTTLAHALQEEMQAPYQHVALDQFRDGLPAKYRGLNAPDGTTGARGLNVVPTEIDSGQAVTEVRFGEDGTRVLMGMRRAIATLADNGVNVIVDDIILTQDFLEDYLRVMMPHSLYFIGVRCPLEVIAAREAMRLGRFPGTAESHFEKCHAHGTYDLEVDTSDTLPAVCARRIRERIESGPPTAFDELRDHLIGG
ncbi:MAG: zeta toxin family protein [Pseudomonadales bacterium]|nr:zeta toxin family protein [Pseudomonadales bacterium]MBO7007378.1 zeta toxin family protein [Pseudomonadales bacterium]